MSSVFDALVRKYGPPQPASHPDEPTLAALDGVLPPDLMSFWREHGVGMWLRAKFQFCLPSLLSEVVARIFDGDRDLPPDTVHAVGYSAFGELLLWSTEQDRVLVDLPRLTVRVPALNARGPDDAARFPLATPLSRLDRPGSFDVFEQTDAADPLFDRARAKLGPPGLEQCYGFVPALALGGSALLNHLEVVDAATHFAILADAGRCRVMAVPSLDAEEQKLRDLGP